MKTPRQFADNCSCSSSIYRTDSDRASIRHFLTHGSRISKKYSGKYIPPRETKLLQSLLRTRAVYEDIRAQLLSDTKQKPYIKPKKRKALSKNEKSIDDDDLLELVNLVDKGDHIGLPHSKYGCNSCCFSSQNKRDSESPKAKEIIRETQDVKEKKSSENRFIPKYMKSSSCECAWKLSDLIKQTSTSVKKKLPPRKSLPALDYLYYAVDEDAIMNKRQRIKNLSRKSYQKIKKTGANVKNAMLERSRKINASKTHSKENLTQNAKKTDKSRVRKSNVNNLDIICTCPKDEIVLKIGKDSIRKFKDDLVKKRKLKGNSDICVSKECLIKLKLKKPDLNKEEHLGHTVILDQKQVKGSKKNKVHCQCNQLGIAYSKELKREQYEKIGDSINVLNIENVNIHAQQVYKEPSVLQESALRHSKNKDRKKRNNTIMCLCNDSEAAHRNNTKLEQRDNIGDALNVVNNQQQSIDDRRIKRASNFIQNVSPKKVSKKVITKNIDINKRDLKEAQQEEIGDSYIDHSKKIVYYKSDKNPGIYSKLRKKKDKNKRNQIRCLCENNAEIGLNEIPSQGKLGKKESNAFKIAKPGKAQRLKLLHKKDILEDKYNTKETQGMYNNNQESRKVGTSIPKNTHASQVKIKHSSKHSQLGKHSLKRCFCILKFKSKKPKMRNTKRRETPESFYSISQEDDIDLKKRHLSCITEPDLCKNKKLESSQCATAVRNIRKEINPKFSTQSFPSSASLPIRKHHKKINKSIETEVKKKDSYTDTALHKNRQKKLLHNIEKDLKTKKKNKDTKINKRSVPKNMQYIHLKHTSVTTQTPEMVSFSMFVGPNKKYGHTGVQSKQFKRGQKQITKKANQNYKNSGLVRSEFSSDISNKKAVRLGSSFSFSIEFYKEKKNNIEPHVQWTNKNNKIERSSSRSRSSSTSTQRQIKKRHKASLVNTMIKRCFCTLNLAKNLKKQKGRNQFFPINNFTVNRITISKVQMFSRNRNISSKMKLKCSYSVNHNIENSKRSLKYECNAICTQSEIMFKYSYADIKNITCVDNENITLKYNTNVQPNNETGNLFENNVNAYTKRSEYICSKDQVNTETRFSKSAYYTTQEMTSSHLTDSNSGIFTKHDCNINYKCNACRYQTCTGINRYWENCYCTMNVQTSYDKRKSKKTVKLVPYECEPGICISGECNPYECQKLILKRLKKGFTKKVSPKIHSKSISTHAVHKGPRLVGSKTQSVSEKSNIIHRPLQYIKTDSSSKQPVRIGSRFSFNVEFYKDHPSLLHEIARTETAIHAPRKPIKKKLNEGNTQHKEVTFSDKRSQLDVPMTDRVAFTTPLNKRFSILKFQKKGKITKKASTQLNMKPLIQDKYVTRSQNTGNRISKLAPYECEPHVFVPGFCDPYECLEKINKRNQVRTKNLQTLPELKSKPAFMYTNKHHLPRQRKSRATSRSLKIYENSPKRLQRASSGNTEKSQRVRIGSSFSFDIEFCKERKDTEPTKHRKYRANTVSTPKPIVDTKAIQKSVAGHDEQLQSKGGRTTAFTTTSDNRCFYTSKVQANVEDINKPKAGKLKRCLCLLKHFGKNKKPQEHRDNNSSMYPIECLPGMCILGERDPRVCYIILNRALIKKHSRSTATEIIARKSIASHKEASTIRNVKTQSGRPTYNRSNESDKQCVRIGSNFSFNIEFYKDNRPSLEVGEEYVPRKNIKYKKQKATYDPSLTQMHNQNINTQKDNAVKANNLLKRCFYTLKLKNARKKVRHVKPPKLEKMKTVGQMTTGKPFLPRIDFMDKANEKLLHDKQYRELGTATDSRRPKKKNHHTMHKGIDLKLLPYECVPQICIPGQCNPLECLERIKLRNLKCVDTGPYTENIENKFKGSGTNVTKMYLNNKQLQTKKFKNKKIRAPPNLETQLNRRQIENETEKSKLSNKRRNVVRIGSSFDFSIEFSKNKATDGTVYQAKMLPKYEGPVTKNKRLQRLNPTHEADTQSNNISMKSVVSSVTPMFKRCFCTSQLRKQLQNQRVAMNTVKIQHTPHEKKDFGVETEKYYKHFASNIVPSNKNQSKKIQSRKHKEHTPTQIVVSKPINDSVFQNPKVKRNVVRIGSDFGYCIDFSENKSGRKSNRHKERKGKILRDQANNCVDDRGLPCQTSQTLQTLDIYTKNKSSLTRAALERCFCTKNLMARSLRKPKIEYITNNVILQYSKPFKTYYSSAKGKRGFYGHLPSICMQFQKENEDENRFNTNSFKLQYINDFIRNSRGHKSQKMIKLKSSSSQLRLLKLSPGNRPDVKNKRSKLSHYIFPFTSKLSHKNETRSNLSFNLELYKRNRNKLNANAKNILGTATVSQQEFLNRKRLNEIKISDN